MVCQSLVRDSLITRFNFVDPDRRVLTRLECISPILVTLCFYFSFALVKPLFSVLLFQAQSAALMFFACCFQIFIFSLICDVCLMQSILLVLLF